MRVTKKRPVSKSKLLTLIKDLDWQSVKAALAERSRALLKYRGQKGANLLHVCCGIDIEKRGLTRRQHQEAGVLLDASLDINREAFTEGEWKATPMWYAVGRGKNLELAKYLIKRGAESRAMSVGGGLQRQPSQQCGCWCGPVPSSTRVVVRRRSCSRSSGALESAKALLDVGANGNFQDRRGKTALHYMLKKRSDPEHVRMLLEHGARLDLPDRDGITAGSMLSRVRGLRSIRSSPVVNSAYSSDASPSSAVRHLRLCRITDVGCRSIRAEADQHVTPGSHIPRRSVLAETAAEQMDPRRRRRRGGRFARSRVGDASSIDAAAERNAIDLESGAAGARVRCERDAGVIVGRAGQLDMTGRSSSTASTSTTKTTCGSARGGEKDAHILKFTRDGKVPAADREAGAGQGQQRHRESRRAGKHRRRRARPTSSTSRTAT